MKIFKYDENTSTKLTQIEVDDSHVLADDELATLPSDFYTPAKLVNGKLVGSTLDESNEFYNTQPVVIKPDTNQLMQANMLKEIADLKQQVAELTTKVGGAENVSSD